MAQASTTVLIKGKNDQLFKSLKQSENGLKRFGNSVKATGALLLGAFAARGLFSGARNLINASLAQEKAEAKVAAVIKATGGAAGFTTGELKKLATQIQSNTTTGDEMVLGLSAILLTFKSVVKEAGIFERAIASALDLEAAGFGNAEGNILQLGKALEDPVRGVTALRRSGVSFTKEQAAGFKLLVEGGKKLEAQILLLDAIERQVGGTAIALAKTRGGQLAQLGNQWGDLKEIIGDSLVKPLTSAIPLMKSLVQEAGLLVDRLDDVGDASGGDFFESSAESIFQTFDILGANLGAWSLEWDSALKAMGLTIVDFLLAPLQQVSSYIADTLIANIETLVGVLDRLPLVDADALGLKGLAAEARVQIRTAENDLAMFRAKVASSQTSNLNSFMSALNAGLDVAAENINKRREARLKSAMDDATDGLGRGVGDALSGLGKGAEDAGKKFNKAAFGTDNLDALTKRLIANASAPAEALKKKIAENVSNVKSPVAGGFAKRQQSDEELRKLLAQQKRSGDPEQERTANRIMERIAEGVEKTADNTEAGGGLG